MAARLESSPDGDLPLGTCAPRLELEPPGPVWGLGSLQAQPELPVGAVVEPSRGVGTRGPRQPVLSPR